MRHAPLITVRAYFNGKLPPRGHRLKGFLRHHTIGGLSAKDWESHDDVIKWKHFPRYWPFVRGIHQSPVNSTHKGWWRGTLMFSLICAWINGWVNNREETNIHELECALYSFPKWFFKSNYDSNVKQIIIWANIPMILGSIISYISFILSFVVCFVYVYALTSLGCRTNAGTEVFKFFIMTSSNGNIFCVTCHLCGEVTG